MLQWLPDLNMRACILRGQPQPGRLVARHDVMLLMRLCNRKEEELRAEQVTQPSVGLF